MTFWLQRIKELQQRLRLYAVNKVLSQHADDSLPPQRNSLKSACSYILLILQTLHQIIIIIIYLQFRLSGKDFNSDTGQLITLKALA